MSRVLVFALLLSACSNGGSQNEGRRAASHTSDNSKVKIPDSDNSSPPAVVCSKYPLVFLHGFMGGKKGSFAGAQKYFEGLGCKVVMTEVAAVNGVDVRGGQIASQLKSILAQYGAQKVNIIAHSQGGLDARYAISILKMGSSVASLTTLSTPHLGSPVADVALRGSTDPFSKSMIDALLNLMTGQVSSQGIASNDTRAAFTALSTSYMRSFNEKTPNDPGVYYQSWGARTGSGTGDNTKTILALTQGYIYAKSGENDGMVAVSSAKWGEYKGTLEADHLDLGGLTVDDSATKFDHLKFLDTVVSDLKTKGY